MFLAAAVVLLAPAAAATGMHAVLSSSTSLRQVNVDGCPRLTLAACPPDWVALDSLVGGSEMKGSGSSGGSTHKQPGLLVRVPQ
jgi:hypothetical protein